MKIERGVMWVKDGMGWGFRDGLGNKGWVRMEDAEIYDAKSMDGTESIQDAVRAYVLNDGCELVYVERTTEIVTYAGIPVE